MFLNGWYWSRQNLVSHQCFLILWNKNKPSVLVQMSFVHYVLGKVVHVQVRRHDQWGHRCGGWVSGRPVWVDLYRSNTLLLWDNRLNLMNDPLGEVVHSWVLLHGCNVQSGTSCDEVWTLQGPVQTFTSHCNKRLQWLSEQTTTKRFCLFSTF